jgi:hypothetical protein
MNTSAIFGHGRNGCAGIRARLTEYHDCRLTGREMQRIANHLRTCADCAHESDQEQRMLRTLAALPSPKVPDDLRLRIRVAISQENALRHRGHFAQLKMAWRNTIGPVLLQASAGLASAILLLASATVFVGMFAHPVTASAKDEPIGMRSAPKFLYESGANADVAEIGTVNGPVMVEAYVNSDGRVYDYRIVSGPNDAQTRTQVENLLLFSVFEPARFFGQPVRGLAVMSFSGVAVHG